LELIASPTTVVLTKSNPFVLPVSVTSVLPTLDVPVLPLVPIVKLMVLA
jgi:hypothetical protein